MVNTASYQIRSNKAKPCLLVLFLGDDQKIEMERVGQYCERNSGSGSRSRSFIFLRLGSDKVS